MASEPAPKKPLDKREHDRRRRDLLLLKQHANSNVRFKPMPDVPKKGLDWVALTLPLLESTAWADMGIYEFRAVSFLLIEHMHHHRTENGYLKATYSQLEGYGIPRKHIKRTLDNLVQLGLIKTMHRGSVSKDPSEYQLTFLNSTVRGNGIQYIPAQNDWTATELRVLDGLQKRPKRQTRSPPKNSLTGGKSATGLVVRSATSEGVQPRPEINRFTRGNRAHSNGLDRSDGPI
jgi:hypothetical protein